MAQYITASDSNVALNSTIPFNVVSIPCNRGCVIPITTGVLTLRGGAQNQARYDVRLEGNIAIPEGGAVTPIACAITLNGVVIPDSVAIVTPTVAENYWHISTSTQITVPSGCCVSVSATYTDATEDDATVTPTPSIMVRRMASLTVSRIA